MEQQGKPIPIANRVKALLAGASPLLFAIILSALCPIHLLKFSRDHAGGTDCSVDKRLMGMFTSKEFVVTDVADIFQATESPTSVGARNRATEKEGFLILETQSKETIRIETAPADLNKTVQRIKRFLQNEKEPTLQV
ncbi:MAG: hypothetical protein GKR87_09345 [Kiritimatiellae bacterium]|nr:hypothetical protein [Kiritimatiellia bacterium]